jgi:hypothetical protein
MQVRKLMMSAAFAVGAMMGPAAAADLLENVEVVFEDEADSPFSGNLAIWGQVVWPKDYYNQYYEEELSEDACSYEDNAFCQTGWGFGGHARALYRLDSTLNVQGEVFGEYHTSLDSCDDECSDADRAAIWLATGGHLIGRGEGSAYGGFLGISGTASNADDELPGHAFGGVEGAMFMDAVTVFGQLGGVVLVDGDDTVESMVFGRAGIRYYVTPNSVLEASGAAGYAPVFDSDASDSDDEATGTWLQAALEYEHRLDDSPFSVFLGYQADFVAGDEGYEFGDESVLASTFKVGLRMNLDEGTLQSEDVNGARTFAFPNLRAPLSYASELN